ncbi:hypothetical protein OIU76_000482 [Salix suchowensis]|nr:hypothetical protein OIU76_000482 [Salix suchowensis]
MGTLKEFALFIIGLGVVSILCQFNQFSYWLPLTSHGDLIQYTVQDSSGEVYHSRAIFLLNHEAMEKDFKVFVYPGGNPGTCYDSTNNTVKSNYASEHYFFMNLIESPFLTKNPEEAHLYFIPISCQPLSDEQRFFSMEEPLRDFKETAIKRYVEGLISTYPYWNRTLGADHFFVSCHDIGSMATEEIPFLLKNAIRLVCSPSYDSNYIPHKDVALPQILELSLPPDGDDMWNRSTVASRPLLLSQEMINPPRTKLGFWAGSPNSDVRKKLVAFQKDSREFEFHFVEKVKRATVLHNFEKEMYGSKFCICPRGETQVGGVCLSESMAFGCVPVIMSDYYDLPFNDILDWDEFSVILKEDDVHELEKILKSIPEGKYEKMHQNVLQVRKYFKWHSPPDKYDEFHLVMLELWKRRHVIRY